MPLIYLGLGSNKGDRLSFIEKAIEEISKIDSTSVHRVSSIYETEPWGIREQNFFLNCVAELTSGLDAHELAARLKDVEQFIGRTNSSKWHEREIDIDILFYGNLIINSDGLRIPHAEVESRNFVLFPLNDLAPELIHPLSGKTISEILAESVDELRVSVFGKLSFTNDTL